MKNFLKRMKVDIAKRVERTTKLQAINIGKKGKFEKTNIFNPNKRLRRLREARGNEKLQKIQGKLCRSSRTIKNYSNLKLNDTNDNIKKDLFKPSTGESTRNICKYESRYENLGIQKRNEFFGSKTNYRMKGRSRKKIDRKSKSKSISDKFGMVTKGYLGRNRRERIQYKDGKIVEEVRVEKIQPEIMSSKIFKTFSGNSAHTFGKESVKLDPIFSNETIQISLTQGEKQRGIWDKENKRVRNSNNKIVKKLKENLKRSIDKQFGSSIGKLPNLKEGEVNGDLESRLKSKDGQKIKKKMIENPLLDEVLLLSGRNSTKFLNDQTDNILKALKKYDKKAEVIISSRSTSVRQSDRKRIRAAAANGSIFDSTSKSRNLGFSTRRKDRDRGSSNKSRGGSRDLILTGIPKLNLSKKIQSRGSKKESEGGIKLNEIQIEMAGLSYSDQELEMVNADDVVDETGGMTDEQLGRIFDDRDCLLNKKEKNRLGNEFNIESTEDLELRNLTFYGGGSNKESEKGALKHQEGDIDKMKFEEMLRKRMMMKRKEQWGDDESDSFSEKSQSRRSSVLVKKIKDHLVEGLKQFNFKG